MSIKNLFAEIPKRKEVHAMKTEERYRRSTRIIVINFMHDVRELYLSYSTGYQLQTMPTRLKRK